MELVCLLLLFIMVICGWFVSGSWVKWWLSGLIVIIMCVIWGCVSSVWIECFRMVLLLIERYCLGYFVCIWWLNLVVGIMV